MASDSEREISRIRQAYQERDEKSRSLTWRDSVYHPRHPMGRLLYEHNYNVLVDALNQLDIDLEELDILDFGCGEGAWLRLLIELGASPYRLTGIDLSGNRIEVASRNNPGINWIRSAGNRIEAASESFDLTMQVVVFSSIVDPHLSQALLAEMLRVTKPGGFIIWIDLQRSTDSSLVGYDDKELLACLPNCSLFYRKAVQPRYFRSRYRYPWLCRTFYHFCKIGCESWLLVFRKNG